MAEFTFTIPDQYVPDVLDAFADKYGYEETIEVPDLSNPRLGAFTLEPNPQTKAQFAKSIIVQEIKDTYVRYKAKKEAQAAIDAATTDAQADADNFTG